MRSRWKGVRGTKFNNVRTEVDGIKFDSKKEAARYGELRLLEKAGHIAALKVHPRFDIVIGGLKICDYVADFSYINSLRVDTVAATVECITVVEDVKSEATKTPMYRLKKKLMKAVYNVEVTEV